MKSWKSILFILIVALLASCKESNDNEGEGGSDLSSLKVKRADLTGASYLALGTSTSSSAGIKAGTRNSENENNVLYKVDSEGNISAIVFFFVVTGTDDNGKDITEQASQSLKLAPEALVSLDGPYVWLYNCHFYSNDENSNLMVELRRQRPALFENPYQYLLDTSTGYLFSLDGDNIEWTSQPISYFPNLMSSDLKEEGLVRISPTSSKVLYMCDVEGAISSATFSNDQLTLKRLTRSGIYSNMVVNGQDYIFGHTPYDGPNDNSLLQGYLISASNSSINTLAIPKGNDYYYSQIPLEVDYGWYLAGFHFDMMQDTISVFETTGTGYNLSWRCYKGVADEPLTIPALTNRGNDYFIRGEHNFMILGHSDKRLKSILFDTDTKQFTLRNIPDSWELMKDGYVNIPANTEINKQGYAYILNKSGTLVSSITRYDFYNMVKQTVMVDRSGLPSYVASTVFYVSSRNVYMEVGTINQNGLSITVTIDPETGKCSSITAPDGRTITTLYKIN